MANIDRRFKGRENQDEIFNEIRTALDTSLLQLVEALEKHDVKYWLDSGTVLGAYRDGKSLSRDSDHDVVITIEELMKPSGQAFLEEFADNFRRSHHFSRTYDKKKIETFTDAETMLERIRSGKPFILTNMGWEGLYDGKPWKYKTYSKRGPQKIDIFVKYPWNAVINGPEQCPKAIDHHVYSLPFYKEKFCRIPSWQVDPNTQEVLESQLETVNGIVKRKFTSYTEIKSYLVELFGENWSTPDPKYAWHSPTKWLSTKIMAKDLLTESVADSELVQQTYLFDPSKI